MAKNKASPSCPVPSQLLIKGFLPVRVLIAATGELLTGNDDDDNDEELLANKEQPDSRRAATSETFDETFFFVKEHRDSSNMTRENLTTIDDGDDDDHETTTKKKQKKYRAKDDSATLFIVNAPVIPKIRTKLLLHSLLGSMGHVSRVTVVENPSRGMETPQRYNHWWSTSQTTSSTTSSTTCTTEQMMPSFLSSMTVEGRFAHVVFESSKEMRRALAQLAKLMSSPSSSATPKKSSTHSSSSSSPSSSSSIDQLPGLVLDRIELQTLADATDRQIREEIRKQQQSNLADDGAMNDDYSHDDNEMTRESHSRSMSTVQRIAQRYENSLVQYTSRDRLLQHCNQVMEEYEQAEEAARIAREKAASEPDADDFVTVSYGTSAAPSAATASLSASKRTLDDTESFSTSRRGAKRPRKKKKHNDGAKEQTNFYRFQTKEKRRQTLQDLRRQFEEDLAKVKQMKEEKKYRPF